MAAATARIIPKGGLPEETADHDLNHSQDDQHAGP